MFTGIVEEIGRVRSIYSDSNLKRITIEARKVLSDLKISESVAVNGVCLTVTDCSPGYFNVEVVRETFRKTNLVKLKKGDKVNLERALKLGERLGGHLVSGHVDGLARIVRKEKSSNENYLWLKTELELLKQIIPRGSVTLEGVSLTAAQIKSNLFKVALIPYTMKETTLGDKRTGDELNLELDYLGKYVRKYLEPVKR